MRTIFLTGPEAVKLLSAGRQVPYRQAMKIAPPRLPADHPDYDLECQQQLQDAYDELVRVAVSAGWPEAAIVDAMAGLAAAHAASMDENRRTDAAIARAKAFRGRMN